MEDCSCVRPREWVRGNVVGAGAFGTVSLAMNKANGKLFAVKSIQVKEKATRELVALENEARILQELDSPWIVRCLGHDRTEENGVLMRNLFMEYMAGGSVSDILNKFGGRLDESVIRTYTRGILQGMDYLHKEGIVHCDIKGKNVLIGNSGVKLADFGSAKRIGSSNIQLEGTPLWMAPEVVKQECQDPPSDIWSLGCTVVEMATGRPPWGAISHPLVAMYKIASTDELPPLPHSLSPRGLDFLDKCLRRDPQQRWNTCQLLKHPFVNECGQVESHQKHSGPQSPTSTLNFHRVWDTENNSVLSPIVPILPLKSRGNTSKANAEELKSEKIVRPPPAQRILDLLEHGASSSENPSPSSPHGHGRWIVVKSSNHVLPKLR